MKRLVLFFLVVAIFALAGCDSGGGGSVDVNGTWNFQYTFVEDPCWLGPDIPKERVGDTRAISVALTQDGQNIAYRARGNNFTWTGTIAGGTLALHATGGGWVYELSGAVDGDTIRGESVETWVWSGPYSGCHMKWTYTAQRTSHTIEF